MTRWFPLFLLLMCAGVWATTTTFTYGGVNHLWSTAGNWDAGVPGVNDSAVLNSNGKDSLNGNISVKSIYIKGTDTLAACGYTITCANWFRVAGAGLWRVDSNVTINGDGGFIISASQVMTASQTWRLDLQGNDSLMSTRTFTCRGLTAAYPSKTLWVGSSSGVIQFTNGGDTTVFLKGGTVVMNHGTTQPIFNLYPTLSGCPIRVGGTTINGTGHWGFGHGSQSGNFKISIPKLQITAGTVTFKRNINSDTIMITDTVALNGNVVLLGDAGLSQSYIFNSGNKPFSCTGTMTAGAGLSSVNKFYWNRSVVACSTFTNAGASYNRNTQAHYDSASTWTVKDAWTWSDTPTVSWSEGGSVTFTGGTAAKTLTSAGKAFQDIILNFATTQKLTLQDSLQADAVTITSGKFDANAKNIRLTGSFLNNSTTSTDTCLLNNTMTFANNATFKMAWKGIKGVLTSLVLAPLGDLNTWLGEHCRTISRLTMASGKTWTGHAHDTLAVQNYTLGDWNGTIWRSDTAGVYTYDSLPTAAGPVLNVRDVYNTGVACTPDTTSSNYGHTWGFVWPPPRIDSISPSSISASGGDTVRIRGKYFGLDGLAKVRFDLSDFSYSVQRNDTLLQVVAPAHAAGIVNVYVSTSDTGYLPGNRDTTTITYASACTYDTLARMYGLTKRLSYALSVPCSTLLKMTCDSVKAYLQIRSLTNMTWQTRDSTAWTKVVLKDTLRANRLQPDKAYYLRLRSIAKNNAYIDTLSTRSARTRLSP